jgi:hypothetical protein
MLIFFSAHSTFSDPVSTEISEIWDIIFKQATDLLQFFLHTTKANGVMNFWLWNITDESN